MITKTETFTNKYNAYYETAQTFSTEAEAIENEKFYEDLENYIKQIKNGTAEFRINNLGNKEYFTGKVDINGVKIYKNDILSLKGRPFTVQVDFRNDWWILDAYECFCHFWEVRNGTVIGRQPEHVPTKDVSNDKKGTISGNSSTDNSGYMSQCMMSTVISSCMSS